MAAVKDVLKFRMFRKKGSCRDPFRIFAMIAGEPLRGTDKKNEYCLPLLQEPLIHFHVPDTMLLSLPLSGAPFFYTIIWT
jgi:hypothetical protein